VNEARGVVQWEGNTLFGSTRSRFYFHNWDETKGILRRITQLVTNYELKEAPSTFELTLWKFKLDKADATHSTNRAAYRFDVPGPVNNKILQYLKINQHQQNGD